MTKIYEGVLEKAKITSEYGYRIHPITKKKTFHYGLDLISGTGNKNIYAIGDGYVQKVVNNQSKATTGYGNYIWVRYPKYNLSLMHAHCSSIKKKKGDTVKKGDVVAIEGKTGAATGVHCHLDMTRIGSDTWLNPKDYSFEFNLTRILKKGSKGDDVKKLQEELKNRGYNIGKFGIDGIAGNDTVNAIKSFQKNNGLNVDGEVGKNTAHKFGWLYQGK